MSVPGIAYEPTAPTLGQYRTWRRSAYSANSNTRNHIPGANRTENGVSYIGFRGVHFGLGRDFGSETVRS
eukprot:2709318-Rhodomonas_salina.1